MEYHYTTSLDKVVDIRSSEFFTKLNGMGWICHNGDKWDLTYLGWKGVFS